MAVSDPKKQAKKLEAKGDRFLKKEKYADALKAYEEAISYDPTNAAIYDKLIETHSHCTDDWNMEEFTRELTWTMEKEVLENPRLERLHEKLSPEFKPIYELIVKFAIAVNEEEEEQTIDEILVHGEKALIPMLEFIRTLKAQQES